MGEAMKFGTKAETLERLQPLLEPNTVLPLFYFAQGQWLANSSSILEEIQNRFPKQKVIIRSSAQDEDTADSSAAGKYLSLPNVPTDNQQSLRSSIEAVFASYEGAGLTAQVLVQPLLSSVYCAGALLTSTLDTLSPYYILSYYDDTDTVTSGRSCDHKTYYRY